MTDKTKNILRNHIKGLIYGQALGDAVGLQTEFKSKKEKIKVKFPYDEPVRNFPYCDWTDDTDQMILLLDTIVESEHNFNDEVFSEDDVGNFATKLKNWKEHGFEELGDKQGLGIGGTTSLVLNNSNFLETPIEVAREIWINSGKKLAANGALMRTSILSILNIFKFLQDPKSIHQEFYRSVRTMCLVTHYDVRCIISCWTLCYLIQHVLYAMITGDRKSLLNLKKSAYKTCLLLLKTIPKSHYPTSNPQTGVRHQPTPKCYTDEEFFNEKGEYLLEKELVYYFKSNLKDLDLDNSVKMGYTYKCLGCVLWTMDVISKFENLQKEKPGLSFERVIIKIVEECGDADTNAAAAGSLLGAYLGYDQLPVKWIKALPNKEWLDKKIETLFKKMKI